MSRPLRGRPPASSREAIESVAIDLFLRDGYKQTTIMSIAEAAGVSRTTFFRYFTSKAEIVWAAFDAHTERLRERLDVDTSGAPTLAEVRRAVVDTLRLDLDEGGLSMRRFHLLDSSAELRSEESEHWRSWAKTISDHVARRNGLNASAALPSAIGGAIQAAMLATLRQWATVPAPPQRILNDLDSALTPVCDALQRLLDR